MSTFCYVVLPIVVLLGLLRKCQEYTWGKCKDRSNLKDKVFLVTGANSGIGKETVKELIKRNARVIMACRNIDNANNTIKEIRRNIHTGEMIPMEIDLSSLSSIRKFCYNVLKEFKQIHGLINNAGVYVPLNNHALTNDGFEIHFGINHLGHYLLTNLLLDRIKSSAPSRIVIVTSKLLESGTIDFSNLNAEKGLQKKGRMNPGYCNSKLANLYFGKELSKRIENSGVNVYMVCPGFTYTGLFRNVKRSWFHYILFAPIALLFLRTANQGAQTVINCATDVNLSNESGLLYRNCKVYNSKKKFDDDISKKLWDISASLTRLETVE